MLDIPWERGLGGRAVWGPGYPTSGGCREGVPGGVPGGGGPGGGVHKSVHP